MCEHSPLSADDCKVHKSLRTTVRVFLRSEEKKKDNLKLKEAKEQAEAKEVEEATPGAEASQGQIQEGKESEAQPAALVTQEEQGDTPASNGDAVKADESQEAAPNGVAQVCSPSTMPIFISRVTNSLCNQDAAAADENEQGTADDQVAEVSKDDAEETEKPDQEAAEGAGDAETETADEDAKAQAEFAGNYPYGAANGAFPNMGFAGAGDFNQMQMMLAMQNGMPPGAFAGFPMMGPCSPRHPLRRIDANGPQVCPG